MRFLPSIGKLFSRVRRCRAGSSIHSSRGTQSEPLPFPAAATSPPKREREEPEALLAYESEDRLQITENGLVFRMKVVEIQEHFKLSMLDCECIINNMLDMELHKRRNKCQVDLCLTPSTVYLTRVKPWKLIHDHHMDSVVHCCSSARDGRALFYFVSMPREDKILCFHLRSMKKSKAVTVQRICKVMSYAKSLLPGPPHLQEEPALTESKKPSVPSSAIGTDEVLSAADPCTPSIEDNADVEVTGVRTSENEDGRNKCLCLAVSGKKQHSSELQPAAVAGDGFDLPVILLKPGEKFPETRVVPFLPSPSCHSSASDKDEALQVSEEISAGNEFDLPPVLLLKPGEKFKEQQSLDFVHCSKYYLFDPDELATDCRPRVTLGDERTQHCAEMKDDDSSSDAPSTSCRLGQAMMGVLNDAAESVGEEHRSSTFVVSGKEMHSCVPPPETEFHLPPVILLKPGETFPKTSTSVTSVRASMLHSFDPDEIASDWKPRKVYGEELSIDQAEPLHLGISGGFSKASKVPPPVTEQHKQASLSTLPTDEIITSFPTQHVLCQIAPTD